MRRETVNPQTTENKLRYASIVAELFETDQEPSQVEMSQAIQDELTITPAIVNSQAAERPPMSFPESTNSGESTFNCTPGSVANASNESASVWPMVRYLETEELQKVDAVVVSA